MAARGGRRGAVLEVTAGEEVGFNMGMTGGGSVEGGGVAMLEVEGATPEVGGTTPGE